MLSGDNRELLEVGGGNGLYSVWVHLSATGQCPEIWYCRGWRDGSKG